MTVEIQDMAMDIESSNLPNVVDPSTLTSRIIQSESIQREDSENNRGGDEDDDLAMDLGNNESTEQPTFQKLSAHAARGGKAEYRRVRCPAHRYTPLRENWEQLLTPLVEYLKLQV